MTGVLSDSPFTNEADTEIIICSEAVFRSLQGDGGYTIIDVQLSDKATDQDVNRIRSLTSGPNRTFSDQRASNAEVQGGYLSFALFIYGFLIIIALITVFNIINSIAMSVSARIPQYGAMRAIGMSSRQMIKMILAESITYAAASSIIGCAAGLPIHKFLYEHLVTYRWAAGLDPAAGNRFIHRRCLWSCKTDSPAFHCRYHQRQAAIKKPCASSYHTRLHMVFFLSYRLTLTWLPPPIFHIAEGSSFSGAWAPAPDR